MLQQLPFPASYQSCGVSYQVPGCYLLPESYYWFLSFPFLRLCSAMTLNIPVVYEAPLPFLISHRSRRAVSSPRMAIYRREMVSFPLPLFVQLLVIMFQ